MDTSLLNTPREGTHKRIADSLEDIAASIGGRRQFKYSVIVDNGADGTPGAIEYADDAVGMIPAVGSSLNSWESFVKQYFKPCVIEPDASAPAYYLQHDNMTLKEDGSEAVLTGEDGDVMIEVGRLYYSFTKISDTSFKATIANYRENATDVCATQFGGTEYDYAYRGAFKAGVYGSETSVMRSVSGVAPLVSITRATGRTRATARGSEYLQNPFQLLTLWQIMFLLIYKSRNSQARLGNGYVGASAAQNTGSLSDKPFCYGSTADSLTSVKFLGCEDFYGNVWEWVDGIVLSSDTYYTTYDSSKYNDTGDGFENVEASGLTNATDSGKYVVSTMGDNNCGFLPHSTGGSSSTYYCDCCWVADSVQVAFFGGSWAYGAQAGAFFVDLDSGAGLAYVSIGSRLCRK